MSTFITSITIQGHFVIKFKNDFFFTIDGLRKNGYTAALDGKGVLNKLKLTYKGNVNIDNTRWVTYTSLVVCGLVFLWDQDFVEVI